MRPSLDSGTARAYAALGALGAACTFTINAHADTIGRTGLNPLGGRPIQLLDTSHLVPSASRSARRLFAARAVDRTTAKIARMVRGGNRIARDPYVWGGGHGSFDATGYDCSGSVSYVLHSGGLLATPLDSSGLEGFGVPGPGRHITIYANAQHAWMTIDGRRFDTIALQETGTRWSSSVGSSAGYVVRHPAGL